MQISNNVALNPASFLQDPLSYRHYTTRYVIVALRVPMF